MNWKGGQRVEQKVRQKQRSKKEKMKLKQKLGKENQGSEANFPSHERQTSMAISYTVHLMQF